MLGCPLFAPRNWSSNKLCLWRLLWDQVKLLVKFATFIAMSFLLLFAVWSLTPSLAKRNADLSSDRHVLLRRTETAETAKGDPFSGFNLFGPWTASSVGCTSTGWQGKYSIAGGAVPILSVQIEPKTTTFDWLNSELASQETWMQRFAEIHFWHFFCVQDSWDGWIHMIQRVERCKARPGKVSLFSLECLTVRACSACLRHRSLKSRAWLLTGSGCRAQFQMMRWKSSSAMGLPWDRALDELLQTANSLADCGGQRCDRFCML